MEMICQAVCNVLCFIPAWFRGFLPSVLSGVSEMKPIGNLNGQELLFGGFWWISSLLVSQKVPETIKGYPVSIRFRYPAVSACSHIINKWQNWQPSMPMTACFTVGVRSSFSPHTFFCPSIWYKFSFVTSAQKSQSSADFFFWYCFHQTPTWLLCSWDLLWLYISVQLLWGNATVFLSILYSLTHLGLDLKSCL